MSKSVFNPKFEISKEVPEEIVPVLQSLIDGYVERRNTPVPSTPGKKAGRTKDINDMSDGISLLDPSLKSVFTHVTSDKSVSKDDRSVTVRSALDVARDLIRKSKEENDS